MRSTFKETIYIPESFTSRAHLICTRKDCYMTITPGGDHFYEYTNREDLNSLDNALLYAGIPHNQTVKSLDDPSKINELYLRFDEEGTPKYSANLDIDSLEDYEIPSWDNQEEYSRRFLTRKHIAA